MAAINIVTRLVFFTFTRIKRPFISNNCVSLDFHFEFYIFLICVVN